MNLSGIIAISGKGGLYTVAGQSKNNVIVESVIDGKKSPAFSSNRISALEDISIYTYEGDELLADIFKAIFDQEKGGEAPSHKDSVDDLKKYLRGIIPEYDEERVFTSDIKKLFQWYNLLHGAKKLELKETKEDKEKVEEKSAAPKKETTAKKAPAKKKPAAKKEPAKKKK
jgi:hypothetical protein